MDPKSRQQTEGREDRGKHRERDHWDIEADTRVTWPQTEVNGVGCEALEAAEEREDAVLETSQGICSPPSDSRLLLGHPVVGLCEGGPRTAHISVLPLPSTSLPVAITS